MLPTFRNSRATETFSPVLMTGRKPPREVALHELLGRDTVELETESIRSLLRGRVVMVTGAAGSIGSELCRQIALYAPQQLVIVDTAEESLLRLHQEISSQNRKIAVAPLVVDISDQSQMRAALQRFSPALIFHAAAHKHVSVMENQPAEALRNNALATAALADLAVEAGVERFVLISTDKAINPTSVMGASKRLAEIFVQSLSAAVQHKTKFMAVRFGNVLGSSGSVVPIFKQQIAEGGPVTVTHPEVTRYFMMVSEAAGLVLQAASLGAGGEIFVLDMGKPMRVLELARNLIELSGLRPGKDIRIEIIGLRPGEKLFEELSYEGENIVATSHPKIFRLSTDPQPLDSLRGFLADLQRQLHVTGAAALKQMVQTGVPEYRPYLT